MPIVTTNRLKGNYGAAIVMSKLSGECLVRPVAVDTDIGIDLYCETVSEGEPFLHFWLQVRAGDQCKRDDNGETARCSLESHQLKYWVRQPVPVFIALVPTEWPPHQDPDIYIIDVTAQSLFTNFPPEQQSFTLRSDYHWSANDPTAVREFLSSIVPSTTAKHQVSKGIIADVPTQQPQYVRIRPHVPVSRFKEEILYQLRRTAANAILFSFGDQEQGADSISFRRLLCKIVEQFDDDPHWENFFARALSHHADGNFEVAIDMYRRARECIQNDPEVRDEMPWQEHIHLLKRLEHRASCNYQLNSEDLAVDYSGS